MLIRRLLLPTLLIALLCAGIWKIWEKAPSFTQAQVKHPEPFTAPVVFAINLDKSEFKPSDGATIHPEKAPEGLQGKVVTRGSGAVHLEPAGGAWFTENEQQNRNTAFLQFTGEQAVRTIFDNTGPGEVTLKLTSKYSYEERLARLKASKSRFGNRCALDVHNESGVVLRVEVTPYGDGLVVQNQLGSTGGRYTHLPKGKEDEIYGKGKTMSIRLRWDGVSQAQLFVNDDLLDEYTYSKARAGWKDASFAIGARDRHESTGGFWASEDTVSHIEVRNAGPIRDTIPPTVQAPAVPAQTVFSGTQWLRAKAEDNEGVTNVSLQVDGKPVSTVRSYPYAFFLDTRPFGNGPHQLDFVAADEAGNHGKASLSVNFRNGQASDTEPPQAVTGMGTLALSSTAVTLRWDAAADNTGVTRYSVLRNGAAIGQVPAATGDSFSYADKGLQANTTYNYQVVAEDAAGNHSSLNAPLEITTRGQDGKILKVGPGEKYARPCDAFRAAAAWDTVDIDAAGNYNGDVCAFNNDHLVIRGVNGRPHIDAIGFAAGNQATWIINGTDVLVENIEMSGSKVPDRNGSAIRLRGKDLVLRRIYFHHNQDGILVAEPARGTLVIENSEFAYNGHGDGFSHNIYVSTPMDRFTMRYCYSHNAIIGHLVKSRAKENHILYNRLTDEGSRGSYEIDLSNGGDSEIIGNIVEQAATTENNNIVSYGMEHFAPEHGKQLYVINNTFINHASGGAFLLIANDAAPVVDANNIFWGAGTPNNDGPVRATNNIKGTPPLFVDIDHWDLRPKRGSAAEGTGARVAPVNGRTLDAVYEYVFPVSARVRPPESARDAGALSGVR
jgi:chitodextrinase